MGAECGSGAVFDAEFLEDSADVAFNGAGAEAENAGNLMIAFALAEPPKDFAFTAAEA